MTREEREETLTFDLARYLERPALAIGSIVSVRVVLQRIQDEGFDPEKAYHSARQATPEWPDYPHPTFQSVKPVAPARPPI
jgi:hypothetical protein